MESSQVRSNYVTSDVICILDDDESVLRFLLRSLRSINLEVRGFDNPEELLLEQIAAPACLVVDWRLKNADGLNVIAQCQARWLHTPMILISGHATVPMTVTAMRQGLVNVLQKPLSAEDLCREVLAAIEVGRKWSAADGQRQAARARVEELNEIERSILNLLVQGTPNKRIATQMDVSMRTIEKYRRTLFDKLVVNSAAEAAQVWMLAEQANSQLRN